MIGNVTKSKGNVFSCFFMIFVNAYIFNYLKIKIFWLKISEKSCANINVSVVVRYVGWLESVQNKMRKNKPKHGFSHEKSGTIMVQ